VCRSPDDGEGCRRADRRGVLDHRRPRPQKGSGTPLHRYWEDGEAFYVLNGELTIYLGMEKIGSPARPTRSTGLVPPRRPKLGFGQIPLQRASALQTDLEIEESGADQDTGQAERSL
jgi:hypothetical protein